MNAQLRAACAAATLAGVWGSAEAQGTVEITPTIDVTSASGFYQYNSSGGGDGIFTSPESYGDLAANTPYTFNVAAKRFENPLNTNRPYTFLGVYSGGLVIAMSATAAGSAIGKTWEEVFTPVPRATDEANVLENYLAGNYNIYGFGSFMATNESLFPSWGEASTLVSFSGGAYAGTILATPVPEPASLLALGAGGLILLRRRRRR